MKLVVGNRHLNTRIGCYKCWSLKFMKLTPGTVAYLTLHSEVLEIAPQTGTTTNKMSKFELPPPPSPPPPKNQPTRVNASLIIRFGLQTI